MAFSEQIIFTNSMKCCNGCSGIEDNLKNPKGTDFLLCSECVDPTAPKIAECCGRITNEVSLTEIDGEAFWLCEEHDTPAYKNRCSCGVNFKACNVKAIVCDYCGQSCCADTKCSKDFIIKRGKAEYCLSCIDEADEENEDDE